MPLFYVFNKRSLVNGGDNLDREYFYCYSPPLKKRLLDEGERYICVGINERNKRKFWLFENTPKLNEVMDEWRREKAELKRG